ncbi:MAG: hypothetical protein ACOX7R_04480 [Acetivibrionales bacterium]
MLIQHNTPPVPFEREEDESSITLRTSQLTIKINRQSLACEYYDRSGFLLLSEKSVAAERNAEDRSLQV